ncbi:hypothetical protein NPIL_580591 [Nephila pilipes]|uniref:Fibronectin type-III domain-containing protein n=1 Tax=Nephila pilipes TaxID=299642 RepID=A0A8X6JTY0_NEPPI|nr:hypothetical protein NPIL_580591 [Nephila pilipes]
MPSSQAWSVPTDGKGFSDSEREEFLQMGYYIETNSLHSKDPEVWYRQPGIPTQVPTGTRKTESYKIMDFTEWDKKNLLVWKDKGGPDEAVCGSLLGIELLLLNIEFISSKFYAVPLEFFEVGSNGVSFNQPFSSSHEEGERIPRHVQQRSAPYLKGPSPIAMEHSENQSLENVSFKTFWNPVTFDVNRRDVAIRDKGKIKHLETNLRKKKSTNSETSPATKIQIKNSRISHAAKIRKKNSRTSRTTNVQKKKHETSHGTNQKLRSNENSFNRTNQSSFNKEESKQTVATEEEGNEQPSTTEERKQSSTIDESKQPSAIEEESRQPSTTEEESKQPSTIEEESKQPSTIEEGNQPSTIEESKQPSTIEESKQLSTKRKKSSRTNKEKASEGTSEDSIANTEKNAEETSKGGERSKEEEKEETINGAEEESITKENMEKTTEESTKTSDNDLTESTQGISAKPSESKEKIAEESAEDNTKGKEELLELSSENSVEALSSDEENLTILPSANETGKEFGNVDNYTGSFFKQRSLLLYEKGERNKDHDSDDSYAKKSKKRDEEDNDDDDAADDDENKKDKNEYGNDGDGKDKINKKGKVGNGTEDNDQNQGCPLQPPRNFRLVYQQGYCVYFKWRPPKKKRGTFIDYYIIEGKNDEENQWQKYYQVPKYWKSVKLCGLEPNDRTFRILTFWDSVCVSQPSEEVEMDKKKEHRNSSIDPNDFPSAEISGKLYKKKLFPPHFQKIIPGDSYSFEEDEGTSHEKDPGKVSKLQVIHKTGVCLYLKWKPPAPPAEVDGYILEGRKKKTERWKEIFRTQTPTVYVKICSPEYHDKWIRVKSFSQHGVGPPSKAVHQKNESDSEEINNEDYGYNYVLDPKSYEYEDDIPNDAGKWYDKNTMESKENDAYSEESDEFDTEEELKFSLKIKDKIRSDEDTNDQDESKSSDDDKGKNKNDEDEEMDAENIPIDEDSEYKDSKISEEITEEINDEDEKSYMEETSSKEYEEDTNNGRSKSTEGIQVNRKKSRTIREGKLNYEDKEEISHINKEKFSDESEERDMVDLRSHYSNFENTSGRGKQNTSLNVKGKKRLGWRQGRTFLGIFNE